MSSEKYIKYMWSFLLANYLISAIGLGIVAVGNEPYNLENDDIYSQITSDKYINNSIISSTQESISIDQSEVRGQQQLTGSFQLTDVFDGIMKFGKLIEFIIRFVVLGAAPLATTFLSPLADNSPIIPIVQILIVLINIGAWFMLFQLIANKGRN